MFVLTSDAFDRLLAQLDADRERAAEKYELLRLKLIKCLAWKGCSETEADALADIALDRTAMKIQTGEQIKNLNAYALEILRFVWLEHLRKRRETVTDDGELPEIAVQPQPADEADARLDCLRRCLAEIAATDADRTLIIGYYDADANEKNKDRRKNLASQLGLSMTTLKVKACRLRARLEKCINECAARLSSVTDHAVSDTRKQGGDAG